MSRRPVPSSWVPVRRMGLGFAALIAITCATASVSAQDSYTLNASSVQVSPGGVADVVVTLDSSLGSDVSGWSYGVCHDPLALSLQSVDDGNATLTSNLGGPVHFEELNLFAGGYTHAAVICFSLCASLPVGPSHELTIGHYTALGANGSIADVTFCDTLGSPPVDLIIVDQGTGEWVPSLAGGTVTVVDSSISGLACANVGDACGCSYDLSWTNGTTYDAIEVTIDGALEQTLAGTATSTVVLESMLAAGATANRELCITPIIGGVPGTPVCCTLGCTLDPAPVAGVIAATPVTTTGGACQADLTWSGFVTASAATATITVDGSVSMSGIAGSAALVALPTSGPHEVCVSIVDACGLEATVCTMVECAGPSTSFIRADSNLDGTANVADGIYSLGVLFIGGDVHLCLDGADANDDGMVDISDTIYLLAYLFTNGTPPPAPGITCGPDGTPGDTLGCDDPGVCP